MCSSDLIYISGLSTFVGFSTFQDSIGVQKDITIAGISTVVGVATFRSNVFIDGDFQVLVPEEMRKYVLEKGYIGVDGISLTVGEVQDGAF